MNRSFKRAAILLIALGALGALAVPLFTERRNGAPAFRTAAVLRGDLQVAVSASGTVEPEELVDVGAQVAGKIVNFGQDDSGKIVDYGSYVRKGTVLAQIDAALFTADVAQAEAQVAQAQAGRERAEADLAQLQAKLDQALRDWNRARKLGPSEALSQSAFDSALSAYEVARANVAVGKAAINQAHSAVAQAKAVLGKARQNLDYCTIKSPVDGVIVDRRVNIGQTVVASLNAPSLFLIAKDLKQLQVWVAVNEADIGSIRPDQQVLFTVDAFPGETFEGVVGKIRLNATLTQNVVTYIVEVNTDNSNGRLLPYLTANVRFIVKEHRDVLLVPNSALRWRPTNPALVASRPDPAPGTQPAAVKEAGSGEGQPRSGTLWVQEGKLVRALPVEIGLNDGSWTEVRGEALKDGMMIITGEQLPNGDAEVAATVNPFTPKLPFRKKSSAQSRSGGPSR